MLKYSYDPNLWAISVQYLNIQMIISISLSVCGSITFIVTPVQQDLSRMRLNPTKSKFHDGTPIEDLMYGD